jgi:hypothetical protein
MHLRITCDANEESGVGQVVFKISGPTRRQFASKNYGIGLAGVGVVLMCRDPELNFKRRIRLARKEKKLFMDIMLDLAQMREADQEKRTRIIRERLAEEVPTVVGKYSIADFDKERFLADLKSWLAE